MDLGWQVVSHTDIAMSGSFNFLKLCQGYSNGVRLLGVISNFMLEYGKMNAHSCVGRLFSFLKYNIGWVSYFLQQKLVNHNFRTSMA
jgi:hypothetical protein